MKKSRGLNSETPQWFKDWDANYFKPVETKGNRNEKLIYILLVAVIGLNTAGNWYHTEIIEFFKNLVKTITGGS